MRTVLVRGCRGAGRRAERIAGRHGLSLALLDAGGGLGIPYADDEEPLDLAALGQGVAREMATWPPRPSLRDARLLLRAGPLADGTCRYLPLSRHPHQGTERHEHRDHRRRHPPSAATTPGRSGPPYPADRCGEHPVTSARTWTWSGRCVPASTIWRRISRRRRPLAGDIYAVLDAGAYGYSESMPFFLSHPIPAEVMLTDGHVTVSRERVEVT